MKKRPALCTLSNKRVCFQCLNPTFVLKRSAKATYSYYISVSLDTIGQLEAGYNLSSTLKVEKFSKLAKFRFAKFCENSPFLTEPFLVVITFQNCGFWPKKQAHCILRNDTVSFSQFPLKSDHKRSSYDHLKISSLFPSFSLSFALLSLFNDLLSFF